VNKEIRKKVRERRNENDNVNGKEPKHRRDSTKEIIVTCFGKVAPREIEKLNPNLVHQSKNLRKSHRT
jgi:hypothetical protein